jgi:FtsP/CotA-like multicopper oxidase with cupredoxin domain
VHWHGQEIPAEVDGAEEEKSSAIPPHGHLACRFIPGPAGARFVHTHAMPMSDLSRGTYAGQFAFVYIEPRNNPGQYDQEVFLATHEWEPFYTTAEMEEEPDSQQIAAKAAKPKDEKPNGWEIGYQRFTINGKCLGYGEPVRVKEGQRVLFQFLNASATEIIQLALPGHKCLVVGLDGNPVPHPQPLDVLELGTAERIDAVVEMKSPGVWILGTPHDDDRQNGMGIVVEYANQGGKPRWIKPPKVLWDYTIFGEARRMPNPDETIPLVFDKINGGTGGFNRWTINGKQYDPKAEPRRLQKESATGWSSIIKPTMPIPCTCIATASSLRMCTARRRAGGVSKDVVLVKGFKKIEADLTAAHEGLTLFHCHQQLHMDYGFKLLFDVV